MPKQSQYTLDEAKARAAEVGDEWTPELEASLRKAGKIKDAAPRIGTLKELSLGLAETIGMARPGGMSTPYAAVQKAATGTSAGEQLGAGIVSGLTAGSIGREQAGIPAPQTGVQMGFGAAGQGIGMVPSMIPISGLAGAAAGKIIPSVAQAGTRLAAREAAGRALLGSGLAFGAYSAVAPGSPEERLQRASEGFQTGMILSGVPQLPGVSKVAANAVGRTAVDAATLTGLGAAEGMPLDQNLATNLPMLAGAAVAHKMIGPGGQEPIKRLAKTPAKMESQRFDVWAPDDAGPAYAKKTGKTSRISDMTDTEFTTSFVTHGTTPEAAAAISRDGVTSGFASAPVADVSGAKAIAHKFGGKILLFRRSDIADEGQYTLREGARPVAVLDAGTPERKQMVALQESRLAKTPAEMEVPATAPEKAAGQETGIAALRAAAQTPRANSRVDAAFREFLNGNEDIRGAATRLGVEPAAPTPAMITAKRAEIRTRRKADMAATGITAKEWNEANLGGRNPKDAAEFEVVKSLANPDLVKALEADVAARAGGGKGPLNVANVSVNRAALHAQDYVYQGWGGGKVGRDNPFDAPLIRDKQTAREVTYAYNDRMSTEAIDILKRNGVKEDSPESSAIGKVIEYSGAAGMSPEQWIATPEGQAAMSGVKNPQGVLTAASELRDMLKRIRDDRNAVAEAYGEKPMAEREFFFPKYDQRIPWWKLFGEDSKLSKSMAGPETPDIIGMGLVAGEKGKKFDPHTKPRGADDSKRDWDAHRAMLRYIGDEASYIGGTPGIHNDYMNAKLLEMYGYGKAAEVVRNYGQSDFNRFKWGPMAGIENVFTQGGLLNVAGDVAKWNYDRLADAVFTLNLGWNLVVQPSSAVFVTGVAPVKDSAKGILGANSPEFRRFVDENVFARRVKSREGGSVSDVGRESSAVGMEAKGGDRITHWAQWQNRFIEKQIDYYAAYVGMKHGERLGLQGRELTDFMSDYIKKTQDVYNRQDRPEVVRSKMGQVIAPFSGFAFNMRSHLQENLGIPGASKVGTYTVNEGKAGRAGYAFRIAAGMALANVIARAVSGREDLYGPSALPLYDILTGGGASKGKIGPALVYDADKKTIRAMLDGKYGEGVSRALRQRVKGSRQVSNFIMAMEFSSGNGPFLLPDDQIPQAVLTGVWSTPAGREYLDKMRGKKGGGDVAAPPGQTIRRPMLQRPPQIAPPRGQRLQQPTGGRK